MARERRYPSLRLISLAPSRVLAAWLAVIHAAALVAVLTASLPAAVAGALAVGLLLSLTLGLRRWYYDPSQAQVAALASPGEGRLELILRDGSVVETDILPASTILGALVIVLARDETGRTRRVVIMPDSAGADELRRLRVWLRWVTPAST